MNGGEGMHDEQRSIDGLAAAYALDALSPEERARFEAQASPEAREEAAQLAETATLLSGDSVTPPPSLRASVLDAISAEPQLPAAAAPQASAGSGRAETDGSDASHAHVPPSTPARPVATDASAPHAQPRTSAGPGPAERRARTRWRPLQQVGAVAAGAALLVGGIAIGTQLGGPSQEEALGTVVAADDAQRSEVELEGGATATLIWSAEQGQSVILFDGLGPAPAGSAYQAWYIDAAGPRSAGVFQLAGGSSAVLLEGQLDAGVAVGVTVEPEGGSEAPTTEPFLVVQT